MGFIQRYKDKRAYKKEVADWRPLSDELKRMYDNADACVDWIEAWGTPTRKELLSKYTDMCGLKFSIEHNIPSVDFMERKLKGRCEDMGIYVNDDKVNTHNQETVVLSGSCNGNIFVNNCNVALHHVHVRHNSIANITAENGAYVWVKVYGNQAHIKCSASDRAKIVVFYMNTNGTKTIFKHIVTSSNSSYKL